MYTLEEAQASRDLMVAEWDEYLRGRGLVTRDGKEYRLPDSDRVARLTGCVVRYVDKDGDDYGTYIRLTVNGRDYVGDDIVKALRRKGDTTWNS